MKFIKGVMIGSLITTGVVVACSETNCNVKKKIKRTGKNMLRKMGII